MHPVHSPRAKCPGSPADAPPGRKFSLGMTQRLGMAAADRRHAPPRRHKRFEDLPVRAGRGPRPKPKLRRRVA
jgi:hypothetical protein